MAANEKQATTYVVLERMEAKSIEEAGEKQANFYWVEREEVAARSGTDAIRLYVNGNSRADGGIFYAVPQRSWNPTVVKVETQTKLKFS